MDLSRIDLNLFVVFDAILGEGGITAASRKLNLSQPAVSHALNRLRAVFDDPLFERSGQRMMPTPLARALAEPVGAALRGLSGTLQAGRHFEPGSSSRRFALALRDVLEATLLPPLMRGICGDTGDIAIAAVRSDRRQLEHDLQSGALDAAIDVLLPVSPSVRHMPVLSTPLAVLARRAHPQIRGRLSLKTYLAQQHVQVSSRRRGPGLEDLELQKLGVERQIRLRCQHHAAACRVVAETDLLLTLPERHAAIVNEEHGHQLLRLPFDAPPLVLHLYWHENADRDPACQWLRERIIASLA